MALGRGNVCQNTLGTSQVQAAAGDTNKDEERDGAGEIGWGQITKDQYAKVGILDIIL